MAKIQTGAGPTSTLSDRRQTDGRDCFLAPRGSAAIKARLDGVESLQPRTWDAVHFAPLAESNHGIRAKIGVMDLHPIQTVAGLLLPLAIACGGGSSSGVSPTGHLPPSDAAASDVASIPDSPPDTASDSASDSSSDTGNLPTPPGQRVLVIAANETTIYADLFAFEGAEGLWQHAFTHPVTLGRNGLAWGVGLHDATEIPVGETLKVEGDGKSPMGKFALPQAWGYLPAESVDTRLPYETATPTLLCIDDVGSPYYNSVVDFEAVGLPANDLPSHEDMLRSDDLYKYTIFVAHNSPNPVAGAGSCIFLHLWSHASGSTAGCTAMAEPDLVRLIEWLDPSKSPMLVQVTKANYDRFKPSWNLPELP